MPLAELAPCGPSRMHPNQSYELMERLSGDTPANRLLELNGEPCCCVPTGVGVISSAHQLSAARPLARRVPGSWAPPSRGAAGTTGHQSPLTGPPPPPPPPPNGIDRHRFRHRGGGGALLGPALTLIRFGTGRAAPTPLPSPSPVSLVDRETAAVDSHRRGQAARRRPTTTATE